MIAVLRKAISSQLGAVILFFTAFWFLSRYWQDRPKFVFALLIAGGAYLALQCVCYVSLASFSFLFLDAFKYFFDPYGLGAQKIFFLAVFLVLCAYLLIFMNHSFKQQKLSAIEMAFAGVVCVYLISVANCLVLPQDATAFSFRFSVKDLPQFRSALMFVRVALYALPFFFFCKIFANQALFKKSLSLLIGLGLFFCALTTYTMMAFYGPLPIFSLPFLAPSGLGDAFLNVTGALGMQARTTGNFDEPLLFAQFLLALIAIGLALFFYSQQKRFLWIVFFFAVNAILTVSVAGLIGLLLSSKLWVLGYLVIARNRKLWLIFAGLCAFCGVSILTSWLVWAESIKEFVFYDLEFFWKLKKTSLDIRLNNYFGAWRMFLDHPLGVGVGNIPFYSDYYMEYVPWFSDYMGRKVGTVENFVLQVLAETGILGLVSFCVFYVLLLVGLFKRLRLASILRHKMIYWTAICGLFALFVHHQFFGNFTSIWIVYLAVCTALAKGYLREDLE